MHLSEKAVFYALLERADNNDCSIPTYMTPSLDQLAEAVGGVKSTVVRALDHLEDHGWLTRTRTTKSGARGPGRGHKTTYQLLSGCECPPSCDRYRDRLPVLGDGGRQTSTSPKGSDSRLFLREKGPIAGLRKGPIRTHKRAGQPAFPTKGSAKGKTGRVRL
jgi:DNA-binding transcriptional MocR family regulator